MDDAPIPLNALVVVANVLAPIGLKVGANQDLIGSLTANQKLISSLTADQSHDNGHHSSSGKVCVAHGEWSMSNLYKLALT